MADVSASRTERFFKIALLLKGLDGAAELLGAVALLLVPASTVQMVTCSVHPTVSSPATWCPAPPSSPEATARSCCSTSGCTAS
jgi:hypothetical protein